MSGRKRWERGWGIDKGKRMCTRTEKPVHRQKHKISWLFTLSPSPRDLGLWLLPLSNFSFFIFSSSFALLFSIRARKLISKLVAFHTMTLKIRSQLRPAGHVASQRQFFSCMLKVSVVVVVVFNFLLLITKISIEWTKVSKAIPLKSLRPLYSATFPPQFFGSNNYILVNVP